MIKGVFGAFRIAGVPGQLRPNAMACVRGVVRGRRVSMGSTTPNQANVAFTRWRTAAEQRKLVHELDIGA